MKKKELKGKKIGRLLVIEENGRTSKGNIIWKCLCDCGNIHNVSSAHIGRSVNSCGCLYL